ncbi:MAG: hypothetical protein A2X12_02585 [Bacteroidetes bacterium GWE2_29_8]|nr:MAG: hypothetical protein A2X12_02585 [Bacteroidetes bacterium GWE2_29_8]
MKREYLINTNNDVICLKRISLDFINIKKMCMKRNLILMVLLLSFLIGKSQDSSDSIVYNPYVLGLKGGWREQGVYNYYTQRHNSGSKTDIRKEGYYDKFTNPLKNVESVYTLDFSDNNLVPENQILTYNSSGDVLESVDILRRITAVNYRFRESLPSIVGSNAGTEDLLYEGFEEYSLLTDKVSSGDTCDYANSIDDDFNFIAHRKSITDEESHTGNNSIKVSKSENIGQSNSVSVSFDITSCAALMLLRGILQQAATSQLAQANASSQTALSLLR